MSTWYKTGTVAVTNGGGVVTGTGTAWVNAVQIGDAIWLPDGRAYEVTGVTSATALSIAPNYAGATASGQAYRIQPTRGVVQQLLSTLQTWLAGQQAYLDGPLAGKFGAGSAPLPGVAFAGDVDTGLVNPAANQLALATGGVIRALLSSAGLSLNVPLTGSAVVANASDTTAGRLMTVGSGGHMGRTVDAPDLNAVGVCRPFGSGDAVNRPPGAGWFGGINIQVGADLAAQLAISVSSAPAAPMLAWRRQNGGGWAGWERAYSQGNILGTVGMADGIPTGAIFERGGNANGEYVRWADGTQICWHDNLVIPNRSTAIGSGFTSDVVSWVFPAAFGPSRRRVAFARGDETRTWAGVGSPTTTSVSVRALGFHSAAGEIRAGLMCIGSWN